MNGRADLAARKRERWERMTLALFAARHLVGVALFVWITLVAYRTGDGGWWMWIAALGLIYGGFAALMWLRLFHRYRRRRERRPPV